MTILHRAAGMTGIVLSIVGLLACAAGAIGVWAIKPRVDEAAGAVFNAADDAFDFMTTRLALVHERIESGRQQVSGLAARAQQLQSINATTDPPAQQAAETEPLGWSLDQVIGELKAAETLLDSIEAVTRGVQTAAERVADSRDAESDDSAATAERVSELAGEVAEIIGRLDRLRGQLLEMREKRLAARDFAAILIAEVSELDTRFEKIRRKIDDFDARLVTARERSAATGRQVHQWMTLASVVATTGLLWFGASQACVLNRAWRMARSREDSDA